ncbi:MAG: DNA polymerase I [Bacteroidota bacterium]
MAQQSRTSNTTAERLFLLDGMALAYRAYFSFISNPLINSRGENTSAIYGFVTTLMKILNEEKPEHIAVVFDTRHPTFRHKMYKEYKATREKMPEDLSSQLDKMKEVIQAFNVPLLELPGYEADDIIGTLARKAEKEGVQSYLVTGDKDFMQLISPLIKMYKPGKRGDDWEILDEKAVKQKFGVTPDKVIDVLGLIGDKSDNVPGVPGIGEKTAIPLVHQFGTIENILKNVQKISQKGVQTKLRDNHDKALLSKKLVTIDINVPIDTDIHQLKAKDSDRKKLFILFTELEFKSLMRKFADESVQALPETDKAIQFQPSDFELTDITTDKHQYHIVTSDKELKALADRIKKNGMFVFDTETTSTIALQSELVGISIALKPREAWYIPIRIEEPQNLLNGYHESHYSNCPTIASVKKLLGPVFSDPSIKKIGQNIKFDMLSLAAQDIDVKGVVFDTMIASYILRAEGSHGMDAIAAERLHYKMVSYDELTGTGKHRKELRQVEVPRIAEYSSEDADITYRLYETLGKEVEEMGFAKLCGELEFPLIEVLADMEITGVKLDEKFLFDFSKELERLLGVCIEEIYRFAGEKFNVNSTQQLGKILFENMKLRSGRKTKTGFSTDIDVLESLRNDHPIIERLLEYRQLQKLKSTYADALHALINPKTGRVHTSFNQTVALTGRLSSSDPNLQNIPIKTEIGRSIRKAFIPADTGMKMLAADYSQIELRIMAHLSGDEALTEAFRNGEDIHATTASKVFGVTAKEITRDMRRKAKEVNFGIMYGIGPYGLSTRLGIPQSEGKDIIEKYFQRFPKVKQYINDTLFKARLEGYASTLLGRRRYFPEINSRNANVRGNVERQAINMPVQGTAADMIKLAMINVHKALQEKKYHAKMLLQVHDELVFEVGEKEQDAVRDLVVDKMKNALSLSVPIEVDCGIGNNWFEAH